MSWTQADISVMNAAEVALVQDIAAQRSTPHDLYVVRWCEERMRELSRAAIAPESERRSNVRCVEQADIDAAGMMAWRKRNGRL